MKGSRLKLGLFFAVLLVGLVLLRATPLADLTDYDRFQAFIRATGPWAPVIFLVVYTIGPVFLAPGMLLTLVGSAVFGLGWGYVLITVGSNLGALAAYLVGRWAGREFVEERVADGGRVARMTAYLAEHGLGAVFFARLLMAPYNLLNYVAAVAGIRLRDYVLGTFFGMLPSTFALVFLGDVLRRAWEERNLEVLLGPRTAIGGALLVISVAVPVLLLKRRRGAAKPTV